MNIYLLGISNVGKTTIGKLLAEKLNIPFYDLDEEIKKKYEVTLEQFVSQGTLFQRDMKRCEIIMNLSKLKGDKVVAISPMTYINRIKSVLTADDAITIELRDSVINIYNRLVFSDSNDVIHIDNEYKEAHRTYYVNDIAADIIHYGQVYSEVGYIYDIDGASAEASADELLEFIRLYQQSQLN